MASQPPKLFLKFFRWYCHPRLLKPIEGDLTELYHERVAQFGQKKANRLFKRDVIILFRKDIIKPAGGTYRLNFYGMLKHNFLISLRTFKKYQSTFWINLTGLTAGLTAFMLIGLWVHDEVSKDQFHVHKDRLFKIYRTIKSGDWPAFTADSNSGLLIPELLSEMPEIASAVPVMQEFPYAILSVGDKKLKSSGLFAGKDFFNTFSFNLTQGSPDQVMQHPSSIVISQSLAEKFFKQQNPIGQIMHLVDNTDGEVLYEADYVVSGVFDLKGLNTSEKFDFLLPHHLYLSHLEPRYKTWWSNSSKVYIQLHENVDLQAFESRLDALYQQKMAAVYGDRPPPETVKMHLQPYHTVYLHNRYVNGVLSNGRISYVYLFSAIGLLILLVACINFVNLSTALASRRLKEVGIKKVLGTSKGTLIMQHLMEAFLTVLASTGLAMVLVAVILPGFNEVTGKALIPDFSSDQLGYLMIIMVSTALMAGTYPAFFMSGLAPIDALKAKLRASGSDSWVRKGLIIFQFALSIVLIIAVLTISKQVDYVRSKNLGYNRDNVITFERDGAIVESTDPFLVEVSTIPGVVNATVLEGNITSFDNSGGGYKQQDKPSIQFTFARVGYDYVETLGLELKEGRSFSRDFSNEHDKIILNEKAIEVMGLDDPVGKVVNIRGNREIIGILKDFHYLSLHEPIAPMFLIFEPGDATSIALKLQAGKEMETIEALESAYQEINPGLPFQFTFLDEEYNALYRSELQVASLSTYFATIAIIISCLGLFGLTTFMTQRRIKEIGIRKVLGSSRLRIVALLGTNLFKMLLLAMIIGTPIAFTTLGQWLENFAYRIDLSVWHFVSGAIATIAIASLTVGYETWKAASVNPVNCLKDE